MRQEDDNRADAGNDAIGNQRAQDGRGHSHLDGVLKTADGAVDQVGGEGRKTEDSLKHREQDSGEDDGTENGVKRNAVDAFGPATRGARFDGDRLGNAAGMALALGQRRFGQCGARVRLHEVAHDERIERRAELVETTLAHGNSRDDRDAQCLREGGDINGQAIADSEVEHIQRDHRGPPERDQFHRKAQMIVEVRGVDHDDQCRGDALANLCAHDDVARDALVGAGGREAVSAGQVNQLKRAAIAQRQTAGVALDRDTGIIANLLPRTGQRVEKRRFARVWIADERDHRRGCDGCGGIHATVSWTSGSTSIALACARRIATVIRPMRTASGSRATRPPPCSGSTATPSSKPSSRSRRPSRSDSAVQSIALIVASWLNGRSASVTATYYQ